ncbi:Aste57867_18500 [Aphanomyces stellatus]|uniref:Aste57867_18500 protein n=1 Tax=Aphanomyces stellatus TaxID=120398 RepID=A0A485LA95_9STRA|nr:hypothetical protein As57867_018438 [Aphanomyces stellatus]VFT95236.1 Aste57867_18500 [Aphanomyces stellatus]
MASEKSGFAYWTSGVRSLGSMVKDKTTATVRKVSGTTISVEAEHRSGESFLRTTTDIRDKVNRGDILTFPNGDSFVISTSPNDMFSATVITLKTTSGTGPGVNENETCKMTSLLHNTPMNLPKVSVPTSMDDVLLAAESFGKGMIGLGALGVQKASDLAASAKSFEESVRIYEEPIGTLAQEEVTDSSALHLTEAAVTGPLEEVLWDLEEVAIVSLKNDSSYVETAISLVDVLRRGDDIMIDGEAFKVSLNPAKRFHATQLPLDRPRAKESSADLVPLFRAKHRQVCIRVPNVTVSLAQGSSDLVFQGTPPLFLDDIPVLVGGERFRLRQKAVSPARRSAGVVNVPLFVPQTPVALTDCHVTLKSGENQAETSRSLLALVSRGDFVQIGDETYHVSQNPLKRLTATTIPVEKANAGVDVVDGSISLYPNGARLLKAGDTVKVGANTYTVADHHTGESNVIVPLATRVQEVLPAGTAVFYVGNRYVKATASAAAAAHRASTYKAPVGKFVCLVQGSNVLFTDGDLRKVLKKGDQVCALLSFYYSTTNHTAQISIAGQSFSVSPEPGDLYARDCLALDRRYDGPSLRTADCELAHVTAFERGATDCFVNANIAEKLERGDHVSICGEDYTVAGVGAAAISVSAARTKESVYAVPTTVPDVLVTLAQGSKVAETSSNVTHRIKRGDRVVIGGEVYRVSTNLFHRFTGDHMPLEMERVGPSVDLVDLQVAAYDGDRVIRAANVDFNIYKHGDRMADWKDDLHKRDLLTKTQQTTEAIGDKLRPGAEKVAAGAAVAAEKIKDAAGIAYAKAFGAAVLK